MLRASQHFDGYGNQKQVLANDRREQFVFQNDDYHNDENEDKAEVLEEGDKETIIY